MAVCADCGVKLSLFDARNICSDCQGKLRKRLDQPSLYERLGAPDWQKKEEERRIKEQDKVKEADQDRKRRSDNFFLTTEHCHGLNVTKRIKVVTAECAYGMNIFKDIFASVRNIVGGRSAAMQNTMRDARETVLMELKNEALNCGANAVVAIDLDYTQIGDGGFAMVLLVASGTAVVIEGENE